jgi:predicted DsbA family dithiol-disulfide isomerase
MADALEPVVVDVVSDVVCPWCYIGKKRLEKGLALRPDVPVVVHWRPFQLDPTIPDGGWDRTEYMTKKFGSIEHVNELQRQIAEMGDDEGIVFDFSAIDRSPNTLDAHRLIRWAEEAGLQNEMVDALFAAFFEQGRDVGDPEILGDIAEEVGLDRDAIMERFDRNIDRDTVEDDIARAAAIGIRGVPFFIFAGKMAVSGAEAPEVIAKALDAVTEER